MKRTTAKIDVFVIEIIIFIFLFLSAGFIPSNGGINPIMMMIIWSVVLIMLLLINYKVIHRNLVYVFFLLTGSVLLTLTFKSDSIVLAGLQILMLGVSVIFINGISFKYFSSLYVNVMECLSVISLVFYTAFILFPSLNSVAFHSNISGIPISHFLVFVHNPVSIRNYGMFWEPGAFQSFVSLALLLHCLFDKPRIRTFCIFIITIISTFSTTGYLTLLLFLLLICFRKDRTTHKIKSVILLSTPVFIFLLFFFADFLFSSDMSVFGKVLVMINEGAESTTTTSVRFYAFAKPLQYFWESPFWGCGYLGLQEKMDMYNQGSITCTPVNFFAIYGFVYGLIMISGFYHISGILTNNGLEKIYVFFLLLLIMCSENFIRCPIFIMVPLYSYFPSEQSTLPEDAQEIVRS